MIDIVRRIKNQLWALGYTQTGVYKFDYLLPDDCDVREYFFKGSNVINQWCRVTVMTKHFELNKSFYGVMNGGTDVTILVSFDDLHDHGADHYVKNSANGMFTIKYWIPDKLKGQTKDVPEDIPLYSYNIIYALRDTTQDLMVSFCDVVVKANKEARNKRDKLMREDY